MVRYDGTKDGLFYFSRSTLVGLSLLYDGMEDFISSGMSLKAYSERQASKYAGPYSTSVESIPFLCTNSWRKVFFAFAFCISKDSRFVCPRCGPHPSTIIADGTMLTINRGGWSGTPITARDGDIVSEEVRHRRLARAFVNSTLEGEQRGELVTLLVAFGKHVAAYGLAVPVPAVPVPMNDDAQERMIQLSKYYRIDLFLKWVLQGLPVFKDRSQLRSLGAFISRCLASISPVSSFFQFELVAPMRAAWLAGVIDSHLLQRLKVRAPHLHVVLLVAGARETFPIGDSFRSLLEELCDRSLLCGSGPGVEVLERYFEPLGRPTAGTDEGIELGRTVGIPELRPRPTFPADKDKDPDPAPKGCRHEFNGGGDRTGGAFTVFCPHGVCCANWIIEKAEGRDELFSYIVRHYPKAPEVVIYDFACALEEFCLNRLPSFFKNTLFLVDRFHWWNHAACSIGYDIRSYHDLEYLNTEVAEQNNSALKRIKRTLTRSSQGPFMVLLKLFLHRWNLKKEASMFVGERHARNIV